MQFDYELTFAEFKSALKVHARQKLGRRIQWFIYAVVFPAAAVVCLIATTYAYVTGGADSIDGLIFLDVVLVTTILLLFVVRRLRLRSAFRALFPSGAKNRVTSIVINEEHILTSVEGIGEGRYFWSGVSAFVHNDVVALFYITEQRFLVLPMRILNAAQQTELTDLVSRHVAKV